MEKLGQFRSLAFRNFGFLASFALAKLSIYFIPLLLAATTSAEVYGGIEFSWSVGLLLSGFLAGAPLSGATQRYLVLGDRDVGDIVALTAAVLCLLGLAVWAGGSLLAASPAIAIATTGFAIATVHNCTSALFRMLGRRNLTAWADGTATLVTGLLVLIVWLISGRVTLGALTLGFGLFGIAAAAVALLAFVRVRRPDLKGRLQRAWTIGLPMVAGGVLAMWLGVGGRLTIGLLTPHDVAAYGVAFRVAGLTLGLHQLATTALFARVYAARTRAADRMFAPFLVAVGAASLGIAVFGGPLVAYFAFSSLQGGGEAVFLRILPVVCIQVFFWIGFAMLQLRLNRSRLAGQAFWPLFWVTVGGAGLILASGKWGGLGPLGICWGIALHSACYFATAWWVLARRGLPHMRLGLTGVAGGCALTLVALLETFLRVKQ